MPDSVEAWEEMVVIPTYEVGQPEKNPMFLHNRVYQGSSGAVYPKPVIEHISNAKTDKEWKAVYLENAYVKIMILPQLGGRVQMAYDKIKGRHFVYYNEVIKPALVGLTGPWISGGIEFNWPQHHRPSTYEPVEYKLIDNLDGSKTVWCNEIDRMHRTKGMAGFTLYPNRAFLEVRVKLYNRTAFPQTFLWWANPALHANDHYQSIFPPDVHAVYDHGKRDVCAFPIARGTYYKVDYSTGVDISRYKNIPVPTSYMAVNSKYDFVGGYEHDSQAGIVHIANHHISPGKKQWTWGNGEFGFAWDRNLTDANGPYVELMCGVYTDNQPDFSWLMPYEEKSFSQYFMPYRDLGQIKNATRDALVNLEVGDEQICIQVYTTGEFADSIVQLFHKQELVFEEIGDFSPEHTYEKRLENQKEWHIADCHVVVKDKLGEILVDWQPESFTEEEMPPPAEPATLPQEIKSIEELYLNGLHLEQYRHATYRPEDYYQEALRREPQNAQCNKAMGLLLMRRAQFMEAQQYLQKAVDRLLTRNPNPIDGEAHFYLGQSLEYQGKYEAAYEAYYKAAWNAYNMDSAYFHLARIAARQRAWTEALDLVNRSIHRNANHHKARHLKVFLLRQLLEVEEALVFADTSIQFDPFNHSVRFEKYLLGHIDRVEAMQLLDRNLHAFLEIAQDYASFGAYSEAIEILKAGIDQQGSNPYPMAFYFVAYYKYQQGIDELTDWEEAASASPDYCFPNQLEEVLVLETAIQENPSDNLAPYYLGNFYYHYKDHSRAIELWEQSIDIRNDFPTAWRNLSLAYFNQKGDAEKAVNCIRKAFELDKSDARILLEYDQLLKKLNTPVEERFAFLNAYEHLVRERDDLYLERIALLNLQGQYESAFQLLMARSFHPWEGGEGKVPGQYLITTKAIAKKHLEEGKVNDGIHWLEKAQRFPQNLGEGKLYNALENEIFYWLGVSYHTLGDVTRASDYFEKGARGNLKPTVPWFYNDQQPDAIFYKGLSLMALDRHHEAQEIFNSLIHFAETHMHDEIRMDYFAVSYPEMQVWDLDFDKKNRTHCLYIRGLGYLGKGESDLAVADFNQVLGLENSHPGALIHLQFSQADFLMK